MSDRFRMLAAALFAGLAVLLMPGGYAAAAPPPGPASGDMALGLRPPRAVPTLALTAPSNVRVERSSGTSLKVWWSKVSGAASYKVYRKVAGKWKLVKVTSSLVWVNAKLPKGKVQEYRVAACASAAGRGGCGPMSAWVSAATYAKASKQVNAGGSRFVLAPKELGLRDRWAVGFELLPASWGSAKKKAVVSRRVRLVSSNPAVVSVPAEAEDLPFLRVPQAVLEAKGYGSAKITATLHNGRSASFWVTVRDFAAEVVLNQPPGGLVDMSNALAPELGALARFTLEELYDSEGWAVFSLDDNGELEVDSSTSVPAELRDAAYRVVSYGSFPVRVEMWDGRLAVGVLVAGDWDLRTPRSYVGYIRYRAYEFTAQNSTPPDHHWTLAVNANEPAF